ncbi:hypothetical protein J8C02_08935 [Chloracidobacterium sp. MS 40/45]|uniref:hypothetical protein n=1 Tax=Chloracidobacterium aggregatum TaxID=2851959 RepID=UPI001B8C9887|nr:hypothetical protein [Chloracidobacterium aggregatum]QUV99538.1 hypothetical protein J8C02_08935 [Chloracidobacterium sp. MS 40/45]
MSEAKPKDVVGWTLPMAEARLGDLAWQREARPAAFRQAVFGEGAKRLWVTADGWHLAGGRMCARYARIQTALADVATLMVYPTASPDWLPVFACEWVMLGDRAHVLVLDVECVGEEADRLRERTRSALMPLHARYADALPAPDDLPPWFAGIREDWALFTSGDLTRLAVMQQAFEAYLQATAENLYRPGLAGAQAGGEHPAVTAYKQHHAAHSPGYALLAPKAGEDWTRAFLWEWHFGPLHPPA